jgi:hypothetical protein
VRVVRLACLAYGRVVIAQRDGRVGGGRQRAGQRRPVVRGAEGGQERAERALGVAIAALFQQANGFVERRRRGRPPARRRDGEDGGRDDSAAPVHAGCSIALS